MVLWPCVEVQDGYASFPVQQRLLIENGTSHQAGLAVNESGARKSFRTQKIPSQFLPCKLMMLGPKLQKIKILSPSSYLHCKAKRVTNYNRRLKRNHLMLGAQKDRCLRMSSIRWEYTV